MIRSRWLWFTAANHGKLPYLSMVGSQSLHEDFARKPAGGQGSIKRRPTEPTPLTSSHTPRGTTTNSLLTYQIFTRCLSSLITTSRGS